MLKYLALILSISLFKITTCWADDIVGIQTVSINALGCHREDGVCYATISKSVGPSTCHQNSIRWHSENDINGKLAYSTFLAAMLSQREVVFNVSPTCFVNMQAYPTFGHYSIR